jgi:hypothetical protein
MGDYQGIRIPAHTDHIYEARIVYSDCRIVFSKSRIVFNKSLQKTSRLVFADKDIARIRGSLQANKGALRMIMLLVNM